MTINCLVIDDEQLARQLVREFASKIAYLHLVGEYKNPLESIKSIEKDQIDLLFLDIQMPDISGIDFLKSFNIKPFVILTTAYSEYALDGYDLEVVDYLVKPYSFDRFLKAVEKVKSLLQLTSNQQPGIPGKDSISVHADHKIYKLKFEEIEYIEGLKEYVSYYTSDKRIVALESLKRLEAALPKDQFIRVHKSYIVPIKKIKSLEGNELNMGNKKIPIGRSFKEAVMNKVFL